MARSAVHAAVASNATSLVEQLLEAGANLHAKDEDVWSGVASVSAFNTES